jgi:hypothetical protein
MQPSLFVVLGFAVLTAVGGWSYFRRFQVTRPPIGVVNLRDAVFLVAVLVLMPYLYLSLPLVVVTVLLAGVVLTALHVTLEPVIPGTGGLWAAIVALLSADVGLGVTRGVNSPAFLLINNVILTVAIIGAANLWVQSGMKARGVAVLSAVLMVYDVVATWQLSVMTDVFQRLGRLPLVPVMAWGLPDPRSSLRLGLGDLLLVTVAPLVLRKAFGRTAGLIALGSELGVLAVLLTLLTTRTVTVSIPVMTVLGPLILAQYAYWRRTDGAERTTWQYLRDEPIARPIARAS